MSTAIPPSPPGRRVVVTGVGLVSPLGSSPEAYAAALASGASGVARREPADNHPLQVAALCDDFTGSIGDFGKLDGARKKAIRKGLKLMCRETQMAVAAAQHALADAGVEADAFDPERFGVVLGSDYMLTLPDDYADAVAGSLAGERELALERWGAEGLGQMQPLWMLRYLPNMPASHIAIYNDLRGPNNSLTMREASGLMALGEAMRLVARGDADRMVAGATGTRVMPLQALHALQQSQGAGERDGVVTEAPDAVDPSKLSRPFDRDRRGMVCGEGAGMLVIESAEAAAERGARVYAELAGFASTVVAAQDDTGALVGRVDRAIATSASRALGDADLAADDIGHVNADGLGTLAADRQEADGLRAVLGEVADRVPVTALKSRFGNLGAGGGAVELIGSLLAMDPDGPIAGELPATRNYEAPDPTCPLRVVTEPGVAAGDAWLAINATPQGQAAAVVAKRFA